MILFQVHAVRESTGASHDLLSPSFFFIAVMAHPLALNL